MVIQELFFFFASLMLVKMFGLRNIYMYKIYIYDIIYTKNILYIDINIYTCILYTCIGYKKSETFI